MYASSGFAATATFTPAAAAYSAGDVMDVAKELVLTNSSGQPFTGRGGDGGGGEYLITSSMLMVSETAVQAGETSYLLKLYNVTPPSAHADNAAWDLPSGDRAAYLGSLSLGAPVDIGSTLVVETDDLRKQITVPSTGKIFAELVTASAFTATATARKVTLHGVV